MDKLTLIKLRVRHEMLQSQNTLQVISDYLEENDLDDLDDKTQKYMLRLMDREANMVQLGRDVMECNDEELEPVTLEEALDKYANEDNSFPPNSDD